MEQLKGGNRDMIKLLIRIVKAMVLAGGLTLGMTQWATAESLYEYYTSASTDTLKMETAEMGEKLTATFGQTAISNRQQRIDFAEYYSNLKKLVLYASRLAGYSEYGRDLQFARDNEIFKGLPDKAAGTDKGGPQLDRKDFVNKKYGEMKKNVEEEIETYVDLLKLSLEACETLIQNDLNGFADNRAYQDRIADFKRGREFREYLTKESRFAGTWPDLAGRITRQIARWDPQPASPDDPIINTKIAGAL
jgi:hypothetical protein